MSGNITAKSVTRGGKLVYDTNWEIKNPHRDRTVTKDSSRGTVYTLASPPATTGSGPDSITWRLRREAVWSDGKWRDFGVLQASGRGLPPRATVAFRQQQEGRELEEGSSDGSVTLVEGGELWVHMTWVGGHFDSGRPFVLQCEVTPVS